MILDKRNERTMRFLRQRVQGHKTLKWALITSLWVNSWTSYSAQAHLPLIDLAELTPTQGFSIIEGDYSDTAGYSMAPCGDVNKDGYDDVILGMPEASANGRTGAGISYVIYGGPHLKDIDLATLTATQGFSISGVDIYGSSGNSVAAAGDIDGDGYADIIIGAPRADPRGRSGAGISYVIYGNPYLSNIDFAIFTATQGFSILGASDYDGSGSSVACAGDINKDGYSDLIIGAYGASPHRRRAAGISYVIYGGRRSGDIDLRALTPAQGFSIIGAGDYDGSSGLSVSGAGDANKDGYSDLIIGAYAAPLKGRKHAGVSYVIYGGPHLSNIDLATLASTQGISIIEAAASDYSGMGVSAAGDVNKDGYADLIIGAPFASPSGRYQAGANYIIYGGSRLSDVDLATLTPTQGFSVIGGAARDRSQMSVAGDINKDGYADLIVGVSNVSPHGRQYAGITYIIYGSSRLSNIDLATFSSIHGTSIIGATPYDGSGDPISSAGDMNNDGYGDVIIGAYGVSWSQEGPTKSYVIYGGSSFVPLPPPSSSWVGSPAFYGMVAGVSVGAFLLGRSLAYCFLRYKKHPAYTPI